MTNVQTLSLYPPPDKPAFPLRRDELAALGAIIDAGDALLPPYLGKLIHDAPDSFEDLNFGRIAATVRAMRAAGEPVSVETVADKLPDLSTPVFELGNGPLMPEAGEYHAETCWRAFQVRRARSVFADSTVALGLAPGQAPAIIANAQAALDSVTRQQPDGLPELIDATAFIETPIEPPPELIRGILHKGSKLAFGGSSKSFKTWCLLDLALSVGTGADWLGFPTTQGKVLFVNFEIQPYAWQRRILAVARAKGIDLPPGAMTLWNLRGCAAGFSDLVPLIARRTRREGFALTILDPIYKLYGPTDENAAGDVAALLNSLERLSADTDAAVAFGAHFAKGNAAGKEAIDRISGSGVFARDPDSLLIFTRHEEQDAFTVEPILRNFPPVAPFAVRWQFPLMRRADDLDPARLKQVGGRKPEHQPAELLALLPPNGLANKDWLELADENGIAKRTFYRLRKDLEDGGKALNSITAGKWLPIQPKQAA
jgi:hypothetical protein